MNLLYRRYRCFYENGLWYTLRKISWQLFGTLDPEKDDQWPVHKERFMKRHPKRFPAYASSSIMKKIAHDILIVSGVNETNVPQCLRYRVLHQVEQLTAAGFSVTWIPYERCNKYTPLDCRAIIFYRCPFTEPIGEAIQMAKAINVRTYYDIDDLVFDKNYTDSIPTVQKLSRGERAIYDSGVIRMGATLKLCEYGITTTERLKEQMEKKVLSVFVPNNGNHEYLVDGENCLLYPQGDIDAAISAIEQICNNEALRQKLAKKGFETAEKRDWKVLKSDILKLYI